jgi:sodium-coupled neutral amino acid transporter 11
LVNSIVGAGIIGIPYSLRQSGFVMGLVLLVLVAYLTDKSLRIIIEVACFHPKLKHLGVLTYGTPNALP